MEKTPLLKAIVREHQGSIAAAKLRKEGKIPAIVYGHKEESLAIALDGHTLERVLHSGHRMLEVQTDKKKESVMFKDVQYDYLGKNIIHVDLIRVNIAEMIKVEVAIELKGTAKGASEGGIIQEHLDKIEIECKASNIPDSIVVSVKEMEIGDSLHAGDVKLPEGAKLITKPETLLAACSIVAAAKSAEELEEEQPTTPEVIGETKEDESESAEKEK